MRGCLLASTLLLASCDCGLGPRVTLVVQLLTDVQPGFEFDAVHVDVDGETADYVVELGDRFLEPAPVAELTVPVGRRHLRVDLLDRGAFVARGELLTEITTAASRIVRIQAACRRVTCEPGLLCYDGVCIRGGAVDCPSDAEVCPRECASDADCPPSTDGCSDRACSAGACVGTPRDASCPAGYYCSVGIGCILVPPPDPGGDAGVVQPELCSTCTTNCGTPGEEVCVEGVGTGVCVAEEVLNLRDDDCDERIDEGFGPGEHTHAVVCELGGQLADRVTGGPGGGICAGACGTTLTNCRTLMDGSDGHSHAVSPSSIAIVGDAWFSCPGGTSTTNGHSHSIRCDLGDPPLTADTFYHEIDPGAISGRYNNFCIPPGRVSGECRATWGPMTAY